MPIGLPLGLAAALAWGMTDVSATLSGRRLGSLRVLVVSQLLGLALLLVVAAIRQPVWPTAPWIVVTAVLVGLAGTGAYLTFFTALRIGPLTVVSPITAAYGGLTVVLAVLLTGESLAPRQAVGAAVATGGVVFAGLVFDGGLRSARVVGRGVGFAVVALILFAVMTVGAAAPIRAAGWLPVILIGRLASGVATLALLGLAAAFPQPAAPLLDAPLPAARRAFAIAGLAGVLDVVGLISFSIGLEVSETWLVGLASSFGPAVAVVVGVALLGERLRPTQWLGLVSIGAGLGIVAVS